MDWAIGYFLFAILFLLSFLIVFDLVQGALLFNMKFSKTLQVRAGHAAHAGAALGVGDCHSVAHLIRQRLDADSVPPLGRALCGCAGRGCWCWARGVGG